MSTKQFLLLYFLYPWNEQVFNICDQRNFVYNASVNSVYYATTKEI